MPRQQHDPHVDMVAAAIAAAHLPAYQWARLGDTGRYRFRRMAKAAINTLTEQEGGEA